MERYGLNIAFNMNTHVQLLFNEKEQYEFKIINYNFILTKIKKNSYSLIIKPLDDIKDAELILNKIKIALILLVLNFNSISIELDDEIKHAHILDKPRLIEDGWLVSGDYDLNRTMLFPLIPNLVSCTSGQFSPVILLTVDDFIQNIEKASSLNILNILEDDKLIIALEMFSKLSQYNVKAQFLDLITILEILKPKYSISDKSKYHLFLIKQFIKKIRDEKCEKNSEEYVELNRFLSSMNFWDEKSINKSLKLYVNENKDYFDDFNNIEKNLKKSYDIRSKLVHNGVIKDEIDFNKKYLFLKKFVNTLLISLIESYKL